MLPHYIHVTPSQYVSPCDTLCSTHPVKLWQNAWQESCLHNRNPNLFQTCSQTSFWLLLSLVVYQDVILSLHPAWRVDSVETLRHPLPLCCSIKTIPTSTGSLLDFCLETSDPTFSSIIYYRWHIRNQFDFITEILFFWLFWNHFFLFHQTKNKE